MELTLECDPPRAGDPCECCGIRSTTTTGFAYRDGDAFAIYYAGWSDRHPERGVALVVASGDWDDGTSPADRVSIGFRVHATPTEMTFRVVDPVESPWAETRMFGKMLGREAALAGASYAVSLAIAELIVGNDAGVRLALERARPDVAH